MERHRAMADLPALHAVALRLRDAGADRRTIAVAVGLEEDQIATFLAIADQKLARLEGAPSPPRPDLYGDNPAAPEPGH